MRSVRGVFLLIVVSCIFTAKAFSQIEPITSRFYFPGSIGLSVPFSNVHTKLNDGLVVNTAIEYRPTYMNDIFYRVDYDALNNNYLSYVPTIPTNIIKGKLTSDFLVAGAGYRQQFGKWATYVLVQPGLGIHSFERAVVMDNGVLLTTKTSSSFAVKADAGIEYYITKHFAGVFNPSFYKIFSHTGFNNSHSRFVGFNIGITTTIL